MPGRTGRRVDTTGDEAAILCTYANDIRHTKYHKPKIIMKSRLNVKTNSYDFQISGKQFKHYPPPFTLSASLSILLVSNEKQWIYYTK